MDDTESDYRELVLELCRKLGIGEPRDWQCWERDAPSPELLPAFKTILSTITHEREERRIIAELLLGSLDIALTEGHSIDAYWPMTKDFLESEPEEFASIVQYWACSDDELEDRFLVSKYVIPLIC